LLILEDNQPSNMPSPERRTGTREMVSGDMEVVVYSYPRCVLAWFSKISIEGLMRGNEGDIRTTGPDFVVRPAAVASQPTIKDISWTNAFVSRAFAVLALS